MVFKGLKGLFALRAFEMFFLFEGLEMFEGLEEFVCAARV